MDQVNALFAKLETTLGLQAPQLKIAFKVILTIIVFFMVWLILRQVLSFIEKRMKKTFLVIPIILSFISIGQSPCQEKIGEASSGIEIHLEYRSLQPGEVVRVSLRSSEHVQKVQVRFLDGKTIFDQTAVPGEFISFVGLDMGIEPGLYTLNFSILYLDGSVEHIKRNIEVDH